NSYIQSITKSAVSIFTPLLYMAHLVMHNTIYETLLEAPGPQGSLKGTLLIPCAGACGICPVPAKKNLSG
ncbi:TPA: hypothetical protein ACIAMC_004379, partial [Salmonella enterica subsp. enterica serovar Westhampton]